MVLKKKVFVMPINGKKIKLLGIYVEPILNQIIEL